MCLIASIPKGMKLNDDQMDLLGQAAYLNQDGWGLLYYQKRRVQVRKGIDVEDGLSALEKAPIESNRLIHFRYATHGAKISSNCHPFKASDWWMMHNGIFQHFAKDKTQSDSKQFAAKVATPIILNYQGDIAKLKQLFDSICGWENRLAFMDSKGEVLLNGTWFTRFGMKLSNTYSFMDKEIPYSLSTLKRSSTPGEVLALVKQNPEMFVSLLSHEII